jgi:hypothetical protein
MTDNRRLAKKPWFWAALSLLAILVGTWGDVHEGRAHVVGCPPAAHHLHTVEQARQ